MVPGDSTVVTVQPDDSLCWNDPHAPGWGADFVCRIVRLPITSNGILTVETLPMADGSRRPLVVQIVTAGQILAERLGNPISLQVTAGAEAVVFVEIASSDTTKQSFALNSSIRAN